MPYRRRFLNEPRCLEGVWHGRGRRVVWTQADDASGPPHPAVHHLPRVLPLDRAADSGRALPAGARRTGRHQKVADVVLGVDPATVTRWELGERRPLAGYRQKMLAARALASPCGAGRPTRELL